jgi:multiple sugar transport system substrate-binding protein
VFKDAKNRDAAWKFVSWLSQPEVQVKWYQATSDLPAVKAGWDNPALTGDPMLTAFGEQLSDAKSPPAIGTWDQVAASFDAEVERLVKTDETAAEAAKAIQQKAASIGTGI